MKNIILIDEFSSSQINGIGTYIRELTFMLKNENYNLVIISCSNKTKEFFLNIEDGVKVMSLPPIPYSLYHKIIDKLLALYILDSVDNIFLFNHTPFALFHKAIKKYFPLSKLVFTIHDMTWTMQLLGDTQKFKKKISEIESGKVKKEYKHLETMFKEEQEMYNTVDKIIVLAQESLDLLLNYYKINPAKIVFIPNGLRDSYIPIPNYRRKKLKSQMHVNENEIVILFVGRVCVVKGIFPLLESFKKVLKKYSNCRLVIIGSMFNPAEILIHLKGIEPKVTFTGQIEKDMLKKWYSIADIGVLPSYFEQCSYTGIEMMMNKLPIIASDGFCVKEMFKDDENAKVAHIGDRGKPKIFEDNLTLKILELVSSEETRNRLKNNARNVYESKYKIDYMKQKYFYLFDSMMKFQK